jgi:DNA primase large subunit
LARTKGSKNKNSTALPGYVAMPKEERIKVLANLIVDKIYEDLQGKKIIFEQLPKASDA